MAHVSISRDPFARTEVIRRVVVGYGDCAWCGRERKNNRQFQYGTETDGGTVSWERPVFCCKSCHDSYHS